ncbi:hypothetical protein MRI28_09965 [Nocardiopsis dassonvillei]|uniref:hypothetical protein n=1 Tax=Nocardiopsis dassonvillei TaxID=2014 RepID=UPI00200BACE1|nr:hypothetical protein [Nocardiopsis dassonvillei]MCK9869965.1 hypothetical protein [Nocardiopsis dassonvillei]
MSPSEPSASGPAGRRRKTSEPDTEPEGRSSREGGRRRAGGRRKKESRRLGPLIAIVAGVLVVALIALGVFLYLNAGEGGEGQAAPQTRPAVYRVVDAGSMNEVLATREADSRPLNENELFGDRNAEISSQSIDFTLGESVLAEDCAAAVWGEPAKAALAEADCTQAGRATYVSDTYFGVVAVFNLADVEGSRAVAAALAEPEGEGAQDPGFVLSPSGAEPFDRLGSGYSASDAVVSGHYLVLVWVQPTDSESVEDRVSLSGPLVALANFRDPLYRRMVQQEGTTGGGTEGTTEGTEGTGTEGTGTEGTGTEGTGTGTEGLGTDGTGTDGTGTGVEGEGATGNEGTGLPGTTGTG